MKKKFLFIFLLSEYILNAQQFSYEGNLSSESLTKRDTIKIIYFGINGGYRYNINSHPSLNSNGSFGLLLAIPFSETICLQPEINFWNTKVNIPLNNTSVSKIDLSFLLMLNINFSPFLGFGVVYEKNNDELITLNIGFRYRVELNKILRLFSQLKVQTAGSLDVGGGDSITSLIFCGGLEVAMNF